MVLYLGDSYISHLQEFKDIFIKQIPALNNKNKRDKLYNEIKTLFSDGVIEQWLSEGDEESKEIASKVSQINKEEDTSIILENLAVCITGESLNINIDWNDFLQVDKCYYQINDSNHITFDKPSKVNFEDTSFLLFTINLRVKKRENETFVFTIKENLMESASGFWQNFRAMIKYVFNNACNEYKQAVKLSNYAVGDIIPLNFRIEPSKAGHAKYQLCSQGTMIIETNVDYKDNSLIFKINRPNTPLVKFNMVRIKGGKIKLCGDEERTIEDFYMSEVLVSERLWNSVEDNRKLINEHPDAPVKGVSWEGICSPNGFLDKLNNMLLSQIPSGMHFCLPTELQWAYAFAGGIKTQVDLSNSSLSVKTTSSLLSKEVSILSEQKLSSKLGLVDMDGKTKEWCYDTYPSSKVEKASKQYNYKVVRTGNFRGYSLSNYSGDCVFRLCLSICHDTPSVPNTSDLSLDKIMNSLNNPIKFN